MYNPKIIASSIFAGLVINLSSICFGFTVPKASFEQQTGVLVWTMNGSKERVNADDDLTDLKTSCDVLERLPASDTAKILAKRSKSAPVFQTLTELSARTLTQKLGIAKMKLKINPVMAEIGKDDKPVFLLFPEVHLNSNTRALHRSLANDLLRMTHILDRRKIRILNMYEGAQGTWEKTRPDTPNSIRERNLEATALFDRHGFSAPRIIGEVYSDRVDTEYHDNNDLAIKNILALQAFSHAQAGTAVEDGWSQSVRFLKNNVPGRTRLVELGEYRSYYEDFRKLDMALLRKVSSELCEERSVQMAKYTFDLAGRRRAKVVYMSFGALHTHGIIQQLKKQSASFIVFSPNL